MYDPTKAVAGWLIENREVQEVVDLLGAKYGDNLRLHLVDAQTAQIDPLLKLNDVIAATTDDKNVFIIHPDGTMEGTTEEDKE